MTHRLRTRRAVVFVALVLGAAAIAGCSKDHKLKVTDLDPQEGDFTGGSSVHFTGTGFLQEDGSPRQVKVYFGLPDHLVQGTVIRTEGDTNLYVLAPGGPKGKAVDILLRFDPGGELTIHNKFKYVEVSQAGVEDLGTGSGSSK
jgi:IPT/TIG domain